MSNDTTIQNRDTVRFNVKTFTIVITAIATLVTMLGGWIVIPSRVQAQEDRIKTLEIENKKTSELLIRIDERLAYIQKVIATK